MDQSSVQSRSVLGMCATGSASVRGMTTDSPGTGRASGTQISNDSLQYNLLFRAAGLWSMYGARPSEADTHIANCCHVEIVVVSEKK
jgi:hypothetical protein